MNRAAPWSRRGVGTKRALQWRFQFIAIIGLFIAVAIIVWKVYWNVSMSPHSSLTFDLEICFGIYGLFLASTSYYLSQIPVSCWGWFHVVVSAVGILLDVFLLGHHAYSLGGKPANNQNDIFMVSIVTIQAVNNSAAIRYSCHTFHRDDERPEDEHQDVENDDPTLQALLRK